MREVCSAHQFVQVDARGVQQFLLFHVLGAVGVEVHLGLLVVQSREVPDVVAGFDDAQAFLRQLHGVEQVLHTYLLLHEVVVFGGQRGDEVFQRDACVRLALFAQQFQLLVGGRDVEPVKKRPVQVDAQVYGLVEDVSALFRLARGAQAAVGVVQCGLVAARQVDGGQCSGVGQCGVVLADLFFVVGDTQRVVVEQSLFEARLQRVRGNVLCLCRQQDTGGGK